MNIKEFFKKNAPEALFLLGAFFIIYATFLINYYAGLYVTGIVLIFIAFCLARLPTRKEKKKKEV